MKITILFLPLISFVFTSVFSRKLGRQGAAFLTTFLMFYTAFLSFIAFQDIYFLKKTVVFEIEVWAYSGLFQTTWGFLFDSLSCSILIVVCGVSSIVHLYSVSYMGEDPHLPRFISYLTLFSLFMIILVTAENLLLIFIGWEGVGLCSYLLINFWFTRIQANKAAIKAMIVNRVGDFSLIIGIVGLFSQLGTLDYASLFSTSCFYEYPQDYCFIGYSSSFYCCLLIFIGSVGKSAQLGLHTWLPDAIEGPTPVSALIHAATIVTAGVFLLVRCSPLFEYNTDVLKLITVVGACTSVFAATTGLFQNDIKKIIAYSTCSQLGYMVFACGLSAYNASLFHLVNHAFFKAALFIAAGVVIHACNDEQDIRRLGGGLATIFPITYITFLGASLALIGFPFLAGFYSKEFILESAFIDYTTQGFFSFLLGAAGSFFTAAYSIKIFILVFYTKNKGYRKYVEIAHEGNFFMVFPLMFLFIISLCSGYLIGNLFNESGTSFIKYAVFEHPLNSYNSDVEFMPLTAKLFPLAAAFTGVFLGYIFFLSQQQYSFSFLVGMRNIITFFNKKWFFDRIYNQSITQFIFQKAYKRTYHDVDRGFLELVGPYGFTNHFYRYALFSNRLSSGFIYHYIILILQAVFFFLFLLLFFSKLGFLEFKYLFLLLVAF